MSSPRQKSFFRSGWVWLALYLATMAVLVVVVYRARARVLADMSTPEAQAEWQEWRAAAAKQSTGGPVQRQPPKSPEPPSLVLMRDYFAVVLTGALLFVSLLFATFAIAVRGVLARPPTHHGDR